MARYRKKPIEIEAVQWTEDVSMRTLLDFTNGLVKLNDVDRDFHVFDRLHDTWVKFEYSDWIIKGVQGEFYPCRDDIFAATYEAVTSTTGATNIETTARVFAGLHRSAEETVTRGIDLYEQWVNAGPPPLGTSLARWWDARLAEMRKAINPPTDQTSPSEGEV
ncbi:hypothetical protein [Streptomyces sp. NPDC088736]|uniref:hypothetical protein n=1 Tax=Streptomyces sp. NPDC088736 TaxID=3365881 RepID=UPI003820564E